MTTSIDVPYPNRGLASAALDQYRDVMRDFIMRGLSLVEGGRPEDLIRRALPESKAITYDKKDTNRSSLTEGTFDESHFPHIVQSYFQKFSDLLVSDYDRRRDFQYLLWVIKDYRNALSHVPEVKSDITLKSARQMVETIAKALQTIQADYSESAIANVDKFLQQLSDINRSEGKNQAKEFTKVPWRDAIVPHQDVIGGLLRQEQFAADLQRVYDGTAEGTLYGNPVMFFRHTYLTEGITTLLKESLRRLAGKGGHPIIQAQTGFGGGKTHSLIALYHMVNSGSIIGNTSEEVEDQENRVRIREIIRDSGVDVDEELRPAISVLHGTFLSPTDSRTTEKGDPLNTLWGVMAYQLAGQSGYDIIRDAAYSGSSPGGQQLQALFHEAGPSLILVDEIVNYARNLNDTQLDRLYSFFQTLTDAIPATEDVVMVLSLPASEREQGDTLGVEITSRLETILGRVQAVWRPVEDREGFEVIRRRLFQDSTCNEAVREAISDEFSKLYRRNNVRNKLPDEARTEDYIQRIKASYPIHPEVFDRIFDDWSTYAKFQRTRGALRMMALFIHHLYHGDNDDPLIMPGNLPFYHQDVSGEFLNLLGENWNPVITEVDYDESRVRAIDSKSSSTRQYEIAQRIARTVFLGSMPERQSPGLNDRQIRVGVIMPGLPQNDYDNVLRSMEDQLYYLYRRDGRRYFSSEINVERAVEDRRSKFQYEDDDNEIARRLQDLCTDDRIIVCPENASDVPDEPKTRTVILWPECVRSSSKDTATEEAIEITRFCEEGQPRRFSNALLFNAMHGSRQATVRSIARKILAWNSLVNGKDRIEHLSEQGKQQITSEIDNARQDLDKQLAHAYNYVAGPVSVGIDEIECKWEAMRFSVGDRLEEEIPKFLDLADGRWFGKPTDPRILEVAKQAIEANKTHKHASLNDVIVRLASDSESPRLSGINHIHEAVVHLSKAHGLGYANSYDEDTGNYVSLVTSGGRIPDAISLNDLLIDPEVAEVAGELVALGQLEESDDGVLESSEEGNGRSTMEEPLTVIAGSVEEGTSRVDELEADNATDPSGGTQDEVLSAQESSWIPPNTVELRYRPQGSVASHREARRFINQAITDLEELGVSVSVKQETIVTSVSEIQNVARNIEANESSTVEIVVTFDQAVDTTEEIGEVIKELEEQAARGDSIKLQTR